MVATSLRVEGADQFFALARRLREAGDKDLQKELYAGLNRAAKPTVAAVRQSALDVLPSRGGLGARIATSRITVQRRTGARSVGIKMIARPPRARGNQRGDYDIAAMDRGRLRHPLFGNRRRWYPQTITPGWWSVPTEASGPVAREQLLIAMRNVADKIEG